MKNSILKKIVLRICKLDISDKCIKECLDSGKCDLKDDLGFDSLLMVELVVAIETEYNIEFDMNELDINILRKFESLQELIKKYCGDVVHEM